MLKRPIVWICVTVLSLLGCCFGQTTLTTPTPQNTECVGTDCRRTEKGATDSSRGTTGERILDTAPRVPTPPANLDLPNSRRIPPPYRKTEFEKYVQASVGRELLIFGHEFFEDVPTTFSPVDRIPVRDDYVIGPGDELLIQAWGKIDLDARVVVDRTGQIYIPRVGAINVAGIRYDRLNGFIHSAIGRFFRDFDLNVNIGQLRSIQVFVLGYARRPGTYTVSSLSTLVNALFESGGPASNGSMRHVQLKRNNRLVTDLDVYDLILKGDKSSDATLQSGDVIYIPHVGPLVAVSGSVNHPAIYELRPPTQLGEIVEDSGGLTSVAGSRRVSLERITEHTERVIDEFALNSEGLKHDLKEGDIVRVYPVSPRIGNAVTLRGNVAWPGRYLWHEGMRVSDLIPSRDALITRDYWNEQNNLASGGNDEFASRNGRRRVGMRGERQEPGSEPENQYPRDSSREPGNQSTKEPSREPGNQSMKDPGTTVQPFNADRNRSEDGENGANSDEGMPQEDLRTEIRRRGSAINWEYAVIERLDQNNLSKQLLPFNLGHAVDQPSSKDNQQLLAGDVVTIFSQADVPVATENRPKFVQIDGEVKAPGVYRVEPGDTLRDAVDRAGGLGAHAYLFGSELHRESALKAQRARLGQMVERMQKELLETASSSAGSTPEDRAENRARIQEQHDFIAKLAQVKPTGRVVLGLKVTDSTIDDVPTMALEDGDVFSVPARLDTVLVLGSVYNENAFRFKPGKRVSDYLSNAGGTSRGADKGRVFVIRADGTVIGQHSTAFLGNTFERLRLMPGDTIVVPQRFRTTSILRELRDWSQVFSQLALGSAAIGVLR